MTTSITCLVCDAPLALDPAWDKGEILACGACGQEHELLDTPPNAKVGLAPEVEEDWGE